MRRRNALIAGEYPTLLAPADLLAWRRRLGLQQIELADRLGVEHNAISRWERGVYPAHPLLRLALAGLECQLARAAQPIDRPCGEGDGAARLAE